MVLTITRHSPSTFTWFTLAGEEISRAGFDGDPDITDAEFELNSKTKTFKITDIAGNVTEGTYDISEDGVLTFSQLPSFGISTNKNIMFASSNNRLQVITYEISDRTGDLTDLWLGSKQYDDQGNAYEYLAYHFKKQTGGTINEINDAYSKTMKVAVEGISSGFMQRACKLAIRSVRIPAAWVMGHIVDGEEGMTIDAAWMARVKEIVDYDEHLLFAGLNEPEAVLQPAFVLRLLRILNPQVSTIR